MRRRELTITRQQATDEEERGEERVEPVVVQTRGDSMQIAELNIRNRHYITAVQKLQMCPGPAHALVNRTEQNKRAKPIRID